MLKTFLGSREKCTHFISASFNRPFPSSPWPLFQNEGRCSAFDMEIIFHSHANKTHFHKKGCAPSLILKVRAFRTRKWPIKSTCQQKNITLNATVGTRKYCAYVIIYWICSLFLNAQRGRFKYTAMLSLIEPFEKCIHVIC